MSQLTGVVGSLLTSAALAQGMPPQEPVAAPTKLAFNADDCTSPVYHGQIYKNVIDEFSRYQDAVKQPYNAAEGVFISEGSQKLVAGLDQLKALKAENAFAKDLKLAYIFTHAAAKNPTYFMLDNQAQTVCRIKPETYFEAKQAVTGPGSGPGR